MTEPAPAAAATLTGETGGEKKNTGQEPAANKKKNYPTICRYEFLCLFFARRQFLNVFGSFVKGGAGRARFCKKNKSSERP